MNFVLSYPLHYHASIAARTTELHDHLRHRRVFVVGHSGFYGRWFMDHLTCLINEGVDMEVTGGSRATGLDITDPKTYPTELMAADWVINCAGSASHTDEAHVLGPVRLRSRMRRDATLLQFSSGAARSSLTVYAQQKRVGEFWLGQEPGRTQIVRPFATVGPDMGLDKPFAVSAFIKAALAGQPLRVTSRPVVRSFCHITDLLVQCLHVMVHGDGRPYEVGSDHGITIEQAARLISDRVEVTDDPFSSNAAQDHYVADLSRISRLHHLSIDMDSITSILDTWRAYQGCADPCRSSHSIAASSTSRIATASATLAAA